MNEFNAYDYSVTPKKKGRILCHRILMIVFYVAVNIGFCIPILPRMPMLVAILPLLDWILIFFTWRFVSFDYEYSTVSGTMKFTRVASHSRKDICEVKIKDMTNVAPYEAPYIEKAAAYRPEVTVDCMRSMQEPDLYFATFEYNGRRTIAYFQPTAQMLKILKYYNSSTVVKSVAL